MNDYSKFKVSQEDGGKIYVVEACNYPLIGIGGHGAVFKIDAQRCIKVYAKEEYAEIEKHSYMKAAGSPIMPILYDTGPGYLVIEYITGPNLKDYLLGKAFMPPAIAQELVNMLLEMERLGFLRKDESLRHILLDNNCRIKIIDHFYAYSQYDPIPLKMFRQLDEIGMLESFIIEGSSIAPELFSSYRRNMPWFFNSNQDQRG